MLSNSFIGLRAACLICISCPRSADLPRKAYSACHMANAGSPCGVRKLQARMQEGQGHKELGMHGSRIRFGLKVNVTLWNQFK